MAMQLPVVATAISGIAELVTDGVSGRLAPPNDTAALARVLGELLDDPAQRQRLAREGAATVARMFDRDVNIEDLAALFRGERPAARGDA
jgi:glycosyltransferase involved in cell wall biosynthesis